MNTVLKYIIGLDLLNCHAKFRGDMISHSRERSCKLSRLWFYAYKKYKNGDSTRGTYLQRHIWPPITQNGSDNFDAGISGKLPKVATSIANYTLANHNKINSDDTLPSIIFFKTPFSCDDSNCLWCQRLLLPAMFPMTS